MCAIMRGVCFGVFCFLIAAVMKVIYSWCSRGDFQSPAINVVYIRGRLEIAPTQLLYICAVLWMLGLSEVERLWKKIEKIP